VADKSAREIRKMGFKEAYEGGTADASRGGANIGCCERSFRRHIGRYETEGSDGLTDRRLEQTSNRRAPVNELMALTDEYRRRYTGWNVKHSHSWYRRTGGTHRWYAQLHMGQEASTGSGTLPNVGKPGVHRNRRDG
jgi:hypothetical protein